MAPEGSLFRESRKVIKVIHAEELEHALFAIQPLLKI